MYVTLKENQYFTDLGSGEQLCFSCRERERVRDTVGEKREREKERERGRRVTEQDLTSWQRDE